MRQSAPNIVPEMSRSPPNSWPADSEKPLRSPLVLGAGADAGAGAVAVADGSGAGASVAATVVSASAIDDEDARQNAMNATLRMKPPLWRAPRSPLGTFRKAGARS